MSSLIKDDVGDENDYDKTDDEFDEKYPLFIINHVFIRWNYLYIY